MSTIRSRRAPATKTGPQTIPGKWSVATFGIFLLGAVGLIIAAANGQTGGKEILDNLAPSRALVGPRVSLAPGPFVVRGAGRWRTRFGSTRRDHDVAVRCA